MKKAIMKKATPSSGRPDPAAAARAAVDAEMVDLVEEPDDDSKRPLWWNSYMNDTLDSVYMTQQTDLAKTLVKTAARAFYDDDTVVVVDFLLRVQFLRDGPGMGDPIGVKPRFLKAVLQFLQDQHWVALETVEGIVETRDATRTYRRRERGRFYYIDLNRAVHTIRLRLHRLKTQLEQQQLDAATKSHYVCPNYYTAAKICNGYYDEMDVQNFPFDKTTGLFLCQECEQAHRHNPDPPPVTTYTLQLVDKQEIRDQVTEQLRRLQVQMTAHSVQAEDGTEVHFRRGIYDLLQQIQTVTYKHLQGLPITSNLPSENGAEEYLKGAHCDTTDTDANAVDYQQQVAAETLFYFKNSRDGSRVALEIEHKAGLYASQWAERGIPMRRSERISGSSLASTINAASAAAVTEITTANTSNNNSNSGQTRKPSLLEITDRPAKMACRQTTPYFLKDNTGRSEDATTSTGMDQLMEGTKRLSMDQSQRAKFIPFLSKWGDFAGQEKTVVLGRESKASKLEQFLGSIFHHQQQLQLQQNQNQPQRPMRRSSSNNSIAGLAKMFQSGDSKGAFASVDWESCDAAPPQWRSPGISLPQGPPSQQQQQQQQQPQEPMPMRRSSSNPSLPGLWNSIDLQGFDLNNAFDLFESIEDPILFAQQQQQQQQKWLEEQTSAGAVGSSQEGPSNVTRQDQPQPEQPWQAQKPSLMRRSSSFPSIAGVLQSVDFASFDVQRDVMGLPVAPHIEWGSSLPHPPATGDAPSALKKPAFLARGSSSASGAFLANVMASRDSLIPDGFSFQSRDIAMLDDDQKPPAKMYQNGLPDSYQSRDWSAEHPPDVSMGMPQAPGDSSTASKSSDWFGKYKQALQKQTQMPASVAVAASAQAVPPKATAASASAPQKKKGRVKEPAVKNYVEPHDNDILAARGTKGNTWPGNEQYREAIELAKPAYNAIPSEQKYQKTLFSAKFVEQMTAQGRRFLKQDTTNKKWYEMTQQAARNKVGQALREENTPEVRKAKRNKYKKKKPPNDTPEKSDVN